MEDDDDDPLLAPLRSSVASLIVKLLINNTLLHRLCNVKLIQITAHYHYVHGIVVVVIAQLCAVNLLTLKFI